jgi:hypothetical protein
MDPMPLYFTSPLLLPMVQFWTGSGIKRLFLAAFSTFVKTHKLVCPTAADNPDRQI